MTRTTRDVGTWAEDLACSYLRQRGLSLVTRNYRCRRGEIDLVMRAGDDLVFVEVRYRARDDFGGGAESVNRRKRARLIATAQHFLQRAATDEDCACRFDVISISGRGTHESIEWIRDAFQAQ